MDIIKPEENNSPGQKIDVIKPEENNSPGQTIEVIKPEENNSPGQKNEVIKPEENKSPGQIDDSLSVTENNAELPQASESHSAIVAAHYNAIEEKGLTERNKSRIVHLRNFNNWIKSMLINEYMDIIKDSKGVGSAVRVLDMCCGKGGDLLKWRTSDIKHLVCVDIAETSVEQCRLRFEDMSRRQQRERRYQPLFSAEFHVADCTKVRLREKYKDASLNLDLVSCQFSFHYSFESLSQAECMLRNAAECLQPGGYFIGTIPDANDIVKRFRANGLKPFGNEVYKIEFENPEEPFPLFGAKYNFSLMEVVNCPEFLVHFPTLERLAKKHGLELVSKVRFEDFYAKHKDKGRGLLGKMQALETYPTFDGTSLSGEDDEYAHAKQFLESNKVDAVGTLSQPEWEAVSIYMVFAFRKMKPITRDDHGRPVYEQESVPQLPEVSEEVVERTVVESRSSEECDEPSPKKLKSDNATSQKGEH